MVMPIVIEAAVWWNIILTGPNYKPNTLLQSELVNFGTGRLLKYQLENIVGKHYPLAMSANKGVLNTIFYKLGC